MLPPELWDIVREYLMVSVEEMRDVWARVLWDIRIPEVPTLYRQSNREDDEWRHVDMGLCMMIG